MRLSRHALWQAVLCGTLISLVLLLFAHPAASQAQRRPCNIIVPDRARIDGICEINGGVLAGIKELDQGYIFLEIAGSATASGHWSGDGPEGSVSIDLPRLTLADNCWRGEGTAICYAAAADDAKRAQAREDGQWSGGEVAALLLGIVAFYFLPSILAFARSHPNRWVILIVNAVFGATGIVWLGCLVWAIKAVHIADDPQGSNGGESGLNIAANDVARVRIESAPQQSATVFPPSLTAAAPQSPRAHLLAELRELADLRSQGVLDEAEFWRLKTELLMSRTTTYSDGVRS